MKVLITILSILISANSYANFEIFCRAIDQNRYSGTIIIEAKYWGFWDGPNPFTKGSIEINDLVVGQSETGSVRIYPSKEAAEGSTILNVMLLKNNTEALVAKVLAPKSSVQPVLLVTSIKSDQFTNCYLSEN
jgi:predicted aconitase with swiveling domain